MLAFSAKVANSQFWKVLTHSKGGGMGKVLLDLEHAEAHLWNILKQQGQ